MTTPATDCAIIGIINTHLADELGWTLSRISCEWTSEEARDTEETTD